MTEGMSGRQREKDLLNRSFVEVEIGWSWKNWLVIWKKKKLYLPLTPCWETKSRGIKDLNVKNKTLNFLVENMSKYHLDLGVSIDFS